MQVIDVHNSAECIYTGLYRHYFVSIFGGNCSNLHIDFLHIFFIFLYLSPILRLFVLQNLHSFVLKAFFMIFHPQALAALLVYLSFTAAAAKACALRRGSGRLRAAIFAAWAGGEALLSTLSQKR